MSTTAIYPEIAARPPVENVRPSLRMTEEEFLAWCEEDEEVRAELVEEKVILMAAENLIHIELKYWLVWVLKHFVARRELGGRVIGAEFFIRLADQRRLRTPDVMYVGAGRESLIRNTRLDGAPDLAMEIVSPDSQSRDRREKYLEYEKAGVREYWIVDPLSRTVEAYALDASNAYAPIPEVDGKIPSALLPGFYLKPEWLWQEKLPDTIDTLREMGVTI
jgi:Uma2 family endonuclease